MFKCGRDGIEMASRQGLAQGEERAKEAARWFALVVRLSRRSIWAR